MRLFGRLTALLLSWLCALSALAFRSDQYVIELSPASAKLSQQTVNVVYQDRNDFIWVLTQEGLNRYDGSNVISFNFRRGDTLSLSHPYTTDIAEDLEGNIWISTLGGGLNRLNSANFTFSHWTASGAVDSSKPLTNKITRLHTDADGDIWIGYEGAPGFSKFDPLDETFTHFFVTDLDQNTRTTGFAESATGNLYVAMDGAGFYALDLATEIVRSATSASSPENISALVTLEDGNLLVTSENEGAYIFNTATERFRFHPLHSSTAASTAMEIYSVAADRNGNLWFGTASGVAVYSDLDQQTTWLTKVNSGLPNDLVTSIFEDRTGTVWLGTYSGLAQGSESTFQKFSVDEGFVNGEVFSFAFDQRDQLWVGTEAGLNRLRLSKAQTGDWVVAPEIETVLEGTTVMSLAVDGEYVWAGSFSSGLFEINLSAGGVTRFQASSDSYALSNDGITVLKKLEGDRLLVGTYGGGLNIYDRTSGQFEVLRNDASNNLSLSDDRVLCIFEASNGQIWIGTENGLNRFDPATKSFVGFYFDQSDASTLPSNSIYSMAEDSNGVIWVGTRSGGLAYFESPSAVDDSIVFKRLPPNIQLPSNDIYSVVVDEQDRLWLSSNSGLTLVDRSRSKATTFDTSMGLQAQEFNHGASYASDDGVLFFGGVGGFNVIGADFSHRENHSSRLQLTEFKLLNENVFFKAPFDQITSIDLANDYQFASIGFTALDFRIRNSLSYRYMIDGIHDDWINLGQIGVVTVSGLGHGTYRLLLSAIDPSTDWYSDQKTLELRIAPPFWLTTYAFVFYGVAAGSLTFILFRRQTLRSREELERRRELEQAVRERTKDLKEAQVQAEQATKAKSDFLAAMSHEIRTPMHGVLGMTDLLLQSKLNARQQSLATTLRESGISLLGIIDSILDYSKLEAKKQVLEKEDFDLIHLVDQVASLLYENARKNDTSLTVVWETCERNILTGDEGKIRQILINLVGNAIKFTEAGHVELECSVRSVSSEPGCFYQCLFKVKDTGIGIAPEKIDSVFELFTQADVSTTRRYGGTGLGLSISKELADLMGGELNVSSTLGEGSIFTLSVNLEAPVTATESTSLETKSLVLCVRDARLEASIRSKLVLAGSNVTTLTAPELCMSALACFDVIFLEDRLADEVAAVGLLPDQLSVVLLGDHHSLGEEDGFIIVSAPFSFYELRGALAGTELPNTQLNNGLLRAEKTTTKAKILLVEDVKVNQQIAVTMLESMGLQVEVAENGMEAVEMHSENSYDAILMDCQMPILDGFEATRQIREQEIHAGDSPVPVIALTAGGDQQDKNLARDSGMTGFVRKPFSTNDLQEALGGLLPLSSEIYLGSSEEADFELFDQDAIANLAALASSDDNNLLSRLLDGYKTQFADKRELLGTIVDGGDLTELKSPAHAIKSMAANMGDIQSKTIAASLESSSELSAETANSMLQELSRNQSRFVEAFKARFNIG